MGKKEGGFLLAPCGVRGVGHVVLGCVREMSDCAGRLDGGGWGEGAPLILFTFFSWNGRSKINGRFNVTGFYDDQWGY
jgi:hypothetical protein